MSSHVILNYVDTPLRILFWTKGELMLFILPFFLGIITDEFVLGVGVSCFNIWLVRQYKKRFGQGQLQAVMWWYLPPTRRLKAFPPSSIRFYLG